jgi:hypothetical protein
VSKPVAARDNARFGLSREGLAGIAPVANHPMNEQPAPLRENHDFSRKYFAEAGLLDGNQITWKEGRGHAGTGYSEANATERADNFARQTARQSPRHILPFTHRRGSGEGYELFRLALQLPSVEKTLPHDSADTSKAVSDRNDGALYAFLAGAGASRVLLLDNLSIFKSSVLLLL